MIDCRCKSCGTRNSFEEEFAGKMAACSSCDKSIEVPFPPLDLPVEVTEGGSVVYRHEPGKRDLDPAIGEDANIELISKHIEEHIGKIDGVFHELVSDLVHIDVHCVAPSDDRPFHTLITSGMSDRPMNCPPEEKDCRFAELMICLPPDWPLSQSALAIEENYWPVRWLKRLARFPHEYDTWLFHGHTIPNGDPPEPFADNNGFTGWLLLPPLLAPDAFRELDLYGDKKISFLAMLPLYDEEMELKLQSGTEVVQERLASQNITELLDLERPNVAHDDFSPFD